MPATIANRLHITVPGSHISAKAVLWAGLVAGVLFLALEMILMPLVLGVSPWAPVRMIAAITMGTAVLSPADTFDSGALAAAVVIHFVLSLAYAFVFAFIGKGRSMRTDALLGAAFGVLLYLVNFYVFTLQFPWFADARNWITILAHVAFGAALGATYAFWAKRATAQG